MLLNENTDLSPFAVELNHALSIFLKRLGKSIFSTIFNNSITNSHSLHVSLCSSLFQVWQIAYKLKTPTV